MAHRYTVGQRLARLLNVQQHDRLRAFFCEPLGIKCAPRWQSAPLDRGEIRNFCIHATGSQPRVRTRFSSKLRPGSSIIP